jgi:hypothetical protein
MKSLLTVSLLLLSCLVFGQVQKNYIIEINGDTASLSLDETVSIKTRNGQVLNVKLKQKEVLTYADNMLTFQYPSNFTVTKKQFDDIEQILCMSAGGNGLLIQKYKDVNPENIVDLMLDEMTEESKSAGYKETITNREKKLKSGRVIKGKESTLVLDDETNIYTAYPVKRAKGGFLVVFIIIDPTDTKEVNALESFWKTLEITN